MITVTAFGKIDEKEVQKITLSNDSGMSVSILSLGATIQSIIVPDQNNDPVDVILGYDTPQEYWENSGCLGACVGRNCNRIGGASFDWKDNHYQLSANEGLNQLHGGNFGFDKKIWDFTPDEMHNCVTFSCKSPDGEEGFPGNLKAEVTFRLTEDGDLALIYDAVSDQDTIINLTNHSYFNLAGHKNGDVLDTIMTIFTENYTPTDTQMIPTGDILSVYGTPLDFTQSKAIGEDIGALQKTATKGYDHNYLLGEPGELKLAAALLCPRTGIAMNVYTDMEAMQLYTANFLKHVAGKDHAMYEPHSGLCLETQHCPDAVHHPNFCSSIVRAGEHYTQRTKFSFAS